MDVIARRGGKMKISEVHAKLDRRCVIAIRQHSGIF